MYDVVLLSLAEPQSGDGCGDSGACDGCGGTEPAAADTCAGDRPGAGQRVPVLHCIDALTAAGARVRSVIASSDAEIDQVLAQLDGPPRADGLTWPDDDGKTRLVVVVTDDGQLRHVLRRMVRRYAPAPSKRPADLAVGRTVPDLPALAVLPLDAAATSDLVAQLGLPRKPAEVAAAVLGTRLRRLDLLRQDGGSITLDGVLVGAMDSHGQALPWQGRVEVDDAVLTDGTEPLLAAAIGNAGGVAQLDGLQLLFAPDPADGRVAVAVAVPVRHKSLFGRTRIRVEVRRARGRAVSVTPRDAQVPLIDDGVPLTLNRKRSWWVEPGAWAVFTG